MSLYPYCRYLLFFLSTLTVQFPVTGQSVLYLHPAYTENRISENASRCMLKDSRGYIWIGTIDGLNRYDGRQFHIYQHDPRDSTSISGNYIVDIQEDLQGNIWVGTDRGINRYLPGMDGFKKYHGNLADPDQVAAAYSTKIAVTPNGELWIAAYGGLARFNAQLERFEGIPIRPEGHPDGILHEDVTSIGGADRDGFWIGYQDGRLSRYENGQFEHYPGIEHDASIISLLTDNTGGLWIGANDGVYHLSENRSKLVKHLNQECRDIYFMKDRIWLNINIDGIMEWDPVGQELRRVKVYQNGEAISGDVKAFFQDEAGIIWGTFHGLFKQDPYEKRFKHYQYKSNDPNGLSEQFVSDIAEDERGNLLVLTINKGLNYFDRSKEEWQNYQNHPAYNNDLIGVRTSRMTVVGDCAYVLSREDLYEFNLRKGKLRKFESPLLNPGYRGSIVLSGHDSIWIGGEGITLLDRETGQFEKFTPKNPPISHKNYILFQDHEEQIWAITDGNLYQLNRQHSEFEHRYAFGNAAGTFGEIIITAKRDLKGRFWIGRRNGLECFDPQSFTFQHYSIANGLPSNTINSIEFDAHGRIWLGTNKGLSRFDPEKVLFRNFDPLDGVQDEIFLPGASHNTADGHLFFGGVNGFNVFHPDSLLGDNPHPPKLLITDLKIFNESVLPGEKGILTHPISSTKSIELSYQDASISFELLALGFSQPKKNEYAYMIEGVDPDWNYAGTGRTATYHGLPRGESLYFKAKAANHDGVWSEPTVLQIYIHPPFWETGWFRLALLFFLLATIFFYYRWRIQKIRARNLWLEKEVKKQTAEIEHQAADLQIANEQLKLKAEIIKEKARQLDELNKAQARFFTSLSHEFRTPLTLLLGNLDALLQADEPEKVFDKISRRMQMSAQQLLLLINQLMDTAKLESGQYRLRVKEGEITEEIRSICSTFQVLAEQKDITLQFDFDDSAILYCWYDSDILHKVLNNLLSNAIKFTEQGKIDVKLTFIHRGQSGPETVEIQVSDSGIGIPKDQFPFLFNRFFQVEAPLSDRRKGTGIGLSLVKQLVLLHKGRIELNSELGQGTTFRVWLPVGKEKFSAAERPEVVLEQNFQAITRLEKVPSLQPDEEVVISTTGEADSPLLLVVDDNPDIRSFVARQLQASYKIQEAADGREALKMAIAHIPDLIISDVIMPHMNGFELCEALKKDQRTSHIPVILLTALAEQQQKLEGLKQGADAYLSKPFSREELLLRVSNLISFREKLRRKFLSEYSLDQMPEGLSPLDQEFLQTLYELIEDNLTEEPFGIEQLVKASGVSRTQLFRKLKSLTGMSASEFIRDFRLRKAHQLLNEGHHTVSEVIYATGFNSRSYFYKVFKQKFGLAPSQLKKV